MEWPWALAIVVIKVGQPLSFGDSLLWGQTPFRLWSLVIVAIEVSHLSSFELCQSLPLSSTALKLQAHVIIIVRSTNSFLILGALFNALAHQFGFMFGLRGLDSILLAGPKAFDSSWVILLKLDWTPSWVNLSGYVPDLGWANLSEIGLNILDSIDCSLPEIEPNSHN